MTAGIVLDLMLAGLLTATIVYAVVLNRRLDALRRAKDEMRAMIDDFSAAAEKARTGMDALRDAGDSSGRTLKPLIDQAQALREDLGFLIERGSVVADRLAEDVRGARQGRSGGDRAEAIAGDPAARLRKILAATR